MNLVNNPRAFAETVSIDAWRTKYSEGQALADLHIDVVFGTGRIGGDEFKDSPVRFRMSLKRAEVHVKVDCGGILKIPPSSVKRTPISNGKKNYKEEATAQAEADGDLSVSKSKLDVDVSLKAKASQKVTESYEENENVAPMHIMHARTKNGYMFTIAPNRGKILEGQPWSSDEARMKLHDTNGNRKRGEPPEVRVEITCKREDLDITDIQFKDEKIADFLSLPRKKKLAVEQYLKAEIERIGLSCGDLSEPFSHVILGDVTPEVG